MYVYFLFDVLKRSLNSGFIIHEIDMYILQVSRHILPKYLLLFNATASILYCMYVLEDKKTQWNYFIVDLRILYFCNFSLEFLEK